MPFQQQLTGNGRALLQPRQGVLMQHKWTGIGKRDARQIPRHPAVIEDQVVVLSGLALHNAEGVSPKGIQIERQGSKQAQCIQHTSSL